MIEFVQKMLVIVAAAAVAALLHLHGCCHASILLGGSWWVYKKINHEIAVPSDIWVPDRRRIQ